MDTKVLESKLIEFRYKLDQLVLDFNNISDLVKVYQDENTYSHIIATPLGEYLNFENFKALFPNNTIKSSMIVEYMYAMEKLILDPENDFYFEGIQENLFYHRVCYFLAQLAHESGGFRWLTELSTGKKYENRKDLGNTEKGDGMRFKGRSPIMLTGRANYQEFQNDTGINVMDNPTKLADNIYVGLEACFWYWKKHKLNRYADLNDFKGLTKAINGGLTNYDDRLIWLNKIEKVVGVKK